MSTYLCEVEDCPEKGEEWWRVGDEGEPMWIVRCAQHLPDDAYETYQAACDAGQDE